MNGKIDTTESFNKVKIFKPKAVRLCPPRRKKLNQPTKQNKKGFKLKDKSKKKLTNLDDNNIEEINKDVNIYKDNMEEEHCHNELLNIINNSCENKNGENNQKIKRCKAPNKINSEFMKDSYFSSLINEFNNLFLSQTENVK